MKIDTSKENATQENATQKETKLSLGFYLVMLLMIGFVGSALIYTVEYRPAKSWEIKSLVTCTKALENRSVAHSILSRVQDEPKVGKMRRLNAECSKKLESELWKQANLMLAEEKSKN